MMRGNRSLVERFCSVAVLLSVLPVGGCVTSGDMAQAVNERREWRERAAEPVASFEFVQMRSWSTLERDWILLELDRGRQLAVQVRQPCIADIREARSVQVVEQFGNQLRSGRDRLLINGRRCIIHEMRPLRTPLSEAAVDESVRR